MNTDPITEAVVAAFERYLALITGNGPLTVMEKRIAPDHARALLRDLARLQRPVATLHDDGYWVLDKNHPDHAKHRDESDYAGWKLKVYSSLPGADAP